MKHTTLYRKWRPRAFSGIVGQEPIVRTISRAIETDRVSHAYLFSGPRGTGKTSTAKVLAMGLNCENGPTPEPDGTCDSCRAIVNNSSLDVVEMDAASNRGIDETRDLRDRVNLAPVSGRMKVYIIDEVHMLTAEAFNALLKMLEEPPEHVVFVLATTEKHKVLPTIISRCQSFDFRRPGVETLAKKLSEIAQAEKIEAEPEALTVISRAGNGSFRDAEGLLDQLSSFSDGPVTAATVREILGSVGSEVLLETTTALYERRGADALRVVDRLSNEGKDLGQFAGELVEHLRNLMLLPHAPEVALAGVGADERAPLEAQSEAIPTAEVVRLVEAMGDCLGRMKRGADPKLDLELTFLKLARDYTEPDVESLIRRIETLEAALENGNFQASPQRGAEPATAPLEATEPEAESGVPANTDARQSGSDATGPEEREESDEASSAREDGDADRGGGVDLASEWGGIIVELKRRRQALTAAVYGEARVDGFDGQVLRLSFPEEQSFHVGMAKDRKHVDELRKVLEQRIGVKPHIEVRAAGQADGASASFSSPPADPEAASAPITPAPEMVESAPINRQASEPPPEATSAGKADSPVYGDQLPEAGDGDGTIRGESEVFEMARRMFDPRNGGS
ncbi:MAG: DNA polymerase III subunit gamma/tau [Rubrobacteraceae bacterium]